MTKKLLLGACTALVALLPFAASAAPATKTTGINYGPWVIAPSVKTDLKYEDNLYNQKTGAEGGFIASVAPGLKMDGDYGATDLAFGAGFDQNWYLDSSDDDRLNYAFNGGINHALQKNITFGADASFRQRHTDRGDDQVDPGRNLAEPLRFWETKLGADARMTFGDATLRPMFDYTFLDFRNTPRTNGTLLMQDQRDRNVYVAGGRVDYALTKEWGAFTNTTWNWRRHVDNVVNKKDSNGINNIMGVTFQPNKKFKAEAGLGYLGQNYLTGINNDVSELNAAAKFDWQYDEQLRFTANYARSVEETPAGGYNAAIRDGARAGVVYDIDDALALKTGLRYTYTDFVRQDGSASPSRADDLFGFDLGATYELGNGLAANAGYDLTNNDSSVTARDYTSNTFSVGLNYNY